MLQTNDDTTAIAERRQVSADAGDVPHRRCIVTRDSKPISALLRFVVSPDGAIVPDVAGKLPGRGIWVSARRTAVEEAIAGKLFGRAARQGVSVDAGLADLIEDQLRQRCLDLVGMARRGGGAVSGFEKVRGWLSGGGAGLLLEALDGAEDGRRKLARLGDGVPVVTALTRRELGQAFGRDQVVHAAVAPGRIADQLKDAARRLSGFRQKSAD